MSSVSAVNPGIADLLRTFSSGSSPVSPALSSTAVQSALEIASPSDLVQLSAQALQLHQVGGLFGSSQSPQTATDPGTVLLQALESESTQTQPTTTSTDSTAAPVPSPGETFAEQEAATLFGTDLSTGAGTNTISLLG